MTADLLFRGLLGDDFKALFCKMRVEGEGFSYPQPAHGREAGAIDQTEAAAVRKQEILCDILMLLRGNPLDVQHWQQFLM